MYYYPLNLRARQSLIFPSILFMILALLLPHFPLSVSPDTFGQIKIRELSQKSSKTPLIKGMSGTVAGVVEHDDDGLFFSQDEVSIWQDRAQNGPFKSASDAWSNSPGDWDRIVQNKNVFMANPSADRLTTKVTDWDTVHYSHINMRDAAFYYLVTGDATVGTTVKDELYWQITQSGFRYDRNEDYGPSDSGTNFWGVPSWFTRLLFTYDFVKDQFDSVRRAEMNIWLQDAAWMIANNIHEDLDNNFPDRLDRNYTTATYVGANPSLWPLRYIAYDSDGDITYEAPNISQWYNNRKAVGVEFFGLTGAFLGDQALIDHAKIYIEEWIMYSMFPDGTTGEYMRNGDYGGSNEGRNYNALNLQTAVLIAEALARQGDTSLYTFETSNGLGDTTGGVKSIKLGVTNALYELDYTVERYCANEQHCPKVGPTAPENRIDAIADYGPETGKQWVNEIWYAPVGNRHWQDEGIKQRYLRQTQTSPNYPEPANVGTAGPVWAPWGGSFWVLPGMLFMFGDMEDVSNNQTSDQPSVSLSVGSSTINYGASTTLTWGSANSSTCVGENFTTDNATSGQVMVLPNVTSAYTVTCTNAVGSISTSTTIHVIPSSVSGDDKIAVSRDDSNLSRVTKRSGGGGSSNKSKTSKINDQTVKVDKPNEIIKSENASSSIESVLAIHCVGTSDLVVLMNRLIDLNLISRDKIMQICNQINYPKINQEIVPQGSAISITQTLFYGVNHSEVLILQKTLNSLGYTVARTGPGSPGQETNFFGRATENALKNFQCTKMNICNGHATTTGYGQVGPKTRDALMR